MNSGTKCYADNTLRHPDAESWRRSHPWLLWVAGLGFVSVVCLMMAEESANIGGGVNYRTKLRLAGIPAADIGFTIAILCGATNLRAVWSLLSTWWSGFVVALLVLGVVLGLARNGFDPHFGADLRNHAWLLGGFFSAVGLTEPRIRAFSLGICIAVGTACLYWAGTRDQTVSVSELSLVNIRIFSKAMFQYSYMMQALSSLGIVYGLAERRWWLWGVATISIVIHAYVGFYLGATKSIGITLIILYGLSCWCGIALLRGRGFSVGMLFASALVGMFVATIIVGGAVRMLEKDGSVVASRITNFSEVRFSMDSRVEEAGALIRELDGIDWIVGRGFGSTFRSTIVSEANIPHLAIFMVLLKCGAPAFFIVVALLYVYVPAKAIQALLRPRITISSAALLVGAPSIVTWAATMSMSGGGEYVSTFGIGVSVAMIWIGKKGHS